jgi:hypothetical protein
MTLSEKAQTEETGLAPGQRRAEITEAFRRSDSAEAFRAALKEKGYVLARGDKRGFVVVDRFGKVHSLARQIDGVRTRELNAKLAQLRPEQVPSADQAMQAVRQQRADADTLIDARVTRSMSDLSGKLDSRQAARRQKLDIRKQAMDTEHGGERMSLHAAHKSESGKPFARAAGAIFGLFDRVPGLRSVIAPLRRNPKINPSERHRIEREALERRHQRERFMLDRCYRALDRVDARERRSLETTIRRKIKAAENLRFDAGQARHDQIEVNKLDITVPADTMKAPPRGKKQDTEGAWKKRKQQLGEPLGQKPSRPRGYRIDDDR